MKNIMKICIAIFVTVFLVNCGSTMLGNGATSENSPSELGENIDGNAQEDSLQTENVIECPDMVGHAYSGFIVESGVIDNSVCIEAIKDDANECAYFFGKRDEFPVIFTQYENGSGQVIAHRDEDELGEDLICKVKSEDDFHSFALDCGEGFFGMMISFDGSCESDDDQNDDYVEVEPEPEVRHYSHFAMSGNGCNEAMNLTRLDNGTAWPYKDVVQYELKLEVERDVVSLTTREDSSDDWKMVFHIDPVMVESDLDDARELEIFETARYKLNEANIPGDRDCSLVASAEKAVFKCYIGAYTEVVDCVITFSAQE